MDLKSFYFFQKKGVFPPFFLLDVHVYIYCPVFLLLMLLLALRVFVCFSKRGVANAHTHTHTIKENVPSVSVQNSVSYSKIKKKNIWRAIRLRNIRRAPNQLTRWIELIGRRIALFLKIYAVTLDAAQLCSDLRSDLCYCCLVNTHAITV